MKLTPEKLQTENIKLTHGYLGSLKEAHGCAGTTNSYLVLLPKVKTISELCALHEHVEHDTWQKKLKIDEENKKQAGPKPVWDATFTGTRKQWKDAVAAWEKRADKHDFLAKNWTALDTICLQIQGQYGYLNEEWFTSEDIKTKPLLWVLSSLIDHGCRCGCWNWEVLKKEDILEEDEPTFANLDRTTTPPATLITVENTWNFIVNAHIESTQEIFSQLGTLWRQKQNQYDQELNQLRAIRDKNTYYKLNDTLTFSSWEKYTNSNNTLDQSVRQLRMQRSGPGPLDLAADELPIWLGQKTTRVSPTGLFTKTQFLGRDFTLDPAVTKQNSQVVLLPVDTGEGL